MAEQEPKTIKTLIKEIKSDDADVRTRAWRSAGNIGAPAMGPLADLAGIGEMEVARAAKRGMWQIVRHSGRPGAQRERTAVNKALVRLLSVKRPPALKRDVLWMLSEIGDDPCVKRIASLMANEELRDDARMALERIPGDASLDALKSALDAASADFKPNVAVSLRRRGIDVSGIPSAKMTPSKSTEVKPL